MEFLKSKIEKMCGGAFPEMDEFLSKWHHLKIPKGKVFIQGGNICHHVYLIRKGAIRSFFLKDDKEVTEWLAMEGEFCFPPQSFYLEQPGRLWFQAVESAELYQLHKHDLTTLAEKSADVQRFHQLMLADLLMACEKRIESLLTGSAQERYQNLSLKFPEILNRVPLSYIASFIGVTQETLSRIRGAR